MATGYAGSTLQAELNRLANAGTYPDRTLFKDIQGAANEWAGTDGLGLDAALNYKADPARTRDDYKALNAVCNELAGTTDKSAVSALRSIDL
jgi:hypothetical protein